jgi:PAS domain S-box-containing protein
MAYNPFYNIENPELLGYEYAWVDYVKKENIPEGIINKEILNSWKRCKREGLDPINDGYFFQNWENKVSLESIKQSESLIDVSRHTMEEILNLFSESSIRMWIANPNKEVILDMRKEKKEFRRSMTGANLDEKYVGTNSMDLSIRLGKPMSVAGAQHYCQSNHKYADYSAPIFQRNVGLIGSVGIVVQCEEMNKFMLAMTTVAARAIENELSIMKNNAIIFQHNKEKQSILDSVTDAIIYLDQDQIITHANYQMMRLTGLSREELIGQHMGVIETSPAMTMIGKVFPKGEENMKIKLRGKDESFTCFLNCKEINDNEIWIFTEISDIQELADKINVVNTAFFTFDNILGKSPAIRETIALAKKVSAYDTRAVLEGESGTGKEVLAQSIHNAGLRKNGPFVAVDCGAIPRELLESEMFGYEEGAFTGARKGGSRGKFELANKGTLFLDEVSNLPLEMQAKFLRVLQENKIVRIGGDKQIPFNAQILVASNMNLAKAVEKGTFREDLFYRLDIMHIQVPSLVERREDIPIFVSHYIKSNSKQMNKKITGIDEETMRILMGYHWPGNVRQLNNVVERMMIMTDKDIITKEVLPAEIFNPSEQKLYISDDLGTVETLENVNRRYVRRVVEKYNGNIKRASEVLGISRATVYRYLTK